MAKMKGKKESKGHERAERKVEAKEDKAIKTLVKAQKSEKKLEWK
ncbi:MAG: hypothetical protein ACHQ9S_18745 [Candidatus Binatia bacterium]